MLEKYLVVGIVFAACVLMIIYTQIGSDKKEDKNLSFKEKLQKEFSNFKVVERNQNLIICREIANQRIPEELVLIRIDPEQKKNLRTSGKMLIATYSKQPSIREVKKDSAAYLV
ncbi:hypothetical protein [Acinetobacter wuhouensis]|uniref:Uncharacterized protein n=1 Tax=Acinetobacter wuhouensis TaxID=1879050 RepID=A0A4Q7AJ58_9GAMM|nr:hypothetical protein [Acinetobacter wuhouensis]RZG48611.1 hypothetical protein EXU28_02245 [Acinetobacter wuhouensis]RZG71236.1 hypothetical protein EXU29_14790 [Acinetobacter wuhouensis]